MKNPYLKITITGALLALLHIIPVSVPFDCVVSQAADNLRLRDGISYFHDLDQGFPIVADNLDDVAMPQGKPAFLFFGAPGDLNCNRQAKRVVDLYKKYKTTQLKFILINVDEPPNDAARQLIKKHYSGYIPTELFFDSTGKQSWTHAGEVEFHTLSAQAEKVAGTPPPATADNKKN